MKMTTTSSWLAAAGLAIGGLAFPLTAFAATGDGLSDTNQATVNFTQATGGPNKVYNPDNQNPSDKNGQPGTGQLRLDYVSPFDFGSHEIVGGQYVFNSQPDTIGGEAAAPFAQVTDLRAGDPTGWQLNVQQNDPLSDSAGHTINHSTIALTGLRAVTNRENDVNQIPTPLPSSVSVTPGGGAQVVTNAQAKQGFGTWLTAFGTAKTPGVSLTIPNTEHPFASRYSTNLLWTLTATPNQPTTTPAVGGSGS